MELELAFEDLDESSLELDHSLHFPYSQTWEDVLRRCVAKGLTHPCSVDEFAALTTAYQKHVEEEGENLQDICIPALPSPEIFDEGSVPLFSRATRRPMDTKPVTSGSFAHFGSSTPISRKDKGKWRAIPVGSESEDSSLGCTLPLDEGTTDAYASTPLTFYREPTPGFDFDLDGPGPSSPFSRELSSSEWPSPRAPWLFFDVEMEGFDDGKSLEVLRYE